MDEVRAKIINYLLATPKVLALLVFSYLSGHLWTFLVLTYLKRGRKGNAILSSRLGKLALGVGWFALIHVPVYLVHHGKTDFSYSEVLDLLIPTIVFGLFAQMIIFFALTRFATERKNV